MKKLSVKTVFCRIFKAVRPRRIAQSVLAACLFIGATALAAQPARAEGTADILESSRDNYLALYKGTTVGGNQVTKENVDKGLFDGHMSLWKLMVEDSPTTVNGGKRTATSFGGVRKQLRVKFYAYEGEIAFIGSSSYGNGAMITLPDGKTEKLNLEDNKGHIKSKTGYVNGPNGVHKAITDADGKGSGTNAADETKNGYDAFTYEIKQSGVYIVDFYADGTKANEGAKKSFNISDDLLAKNDYDYNDLCAFDITVCKNTGTAEAPQYNAVSGRVWMDAFGGQMNSDSGFGMYGYLYTTTRDGYIWRVALNGIRPYTVALYANQRGGIGKGTNASAYHSVHSPINNYTSFDYYGNMVDKNGNSDGIMIYGPDNETTDIDAPDHMFFNYPDKDLPKSIVADVSKDLFSVTDIKFDGRDPTIKEVVGGDGSLENEKIDNQGTVGVGGYFTVDTSGATSYRVIIDMSNMYARYYHGEDGNNVGYETHKTTGEDHDEEICLSAPWTDSENGKHINFIYYNSDDSSWYNIETQVKDSEGRYDMHPINKGNDMDTVVKCVKLKPDAVSALGLTYTDPNGAETVGTGEFIFKSLGKIMLGNAAVDGETDRIYWNGRDQWGRILPVGTYFGGTGRGKVYAEAKAGEVHFPISDAEFIPNGLAVWLMNADNIVDLVKGGSAYNVNSVTGETAVRSNLYYNNREKSLLRDYSTNWPGSDSGSLLGVWNLPSYNSNEEVGETYNAALNGKWFVNKDGHDFNAQFEDVSIEGKPSYSDENGEKPTKTSGAISNNGVDHGIFDVWTHVISPETKELGTLTLYHFADRKIITGFVFLDTPEDKPGDTEHYGVYDRMTNDHELEGAIIVAEYGDKSMKNDPNNDKLTSGQRWVHYEAKTDTDGYYSIPVDLTAFGNDDLNTDGTYPVDIYVYYNENLSGAITHKVTTVNKDAPYCTAQQYSEFIGTVIRSESVPSVSKQTVNVPKYIKDKRGTENVYLKEVYAGQVGYYAEALGQALTITKKWEPSYLKSSTLEASFTIVGMKQGVRTTIENYFKTEGKADSEGKITVTEYDAESKTVKDVPYDQTAYTAKYGCTAAGVKSNKDTDNVYMAIQHDPNFPSDKTVADIKTAVDTYNAMHPADPVTVQYVLINGGTKIDHPEFDPYKTTIEGKETCDIVYVVENATVEEARGGIYTNKILPKQTYKLGSGNNTVDPEGLIVYRVYENPLGSSSASADAAKTQYGIARDGNEWTYTNILNLTNYTLTLFHDKNADGKLTFNDNVPAGESKGNGVYDPNDTLTEDIIIPGATVTIAKMLPGGTTEDSQGFTHTISDTTYAARLAEYVDEYKKDTGKEAKNTGGEYEEEYETWVKTKIDKSTTEDGIQELIMPNQEFTTDQYGQITFEGLSSGQYSIHVIYETKEDYNIVTVDGANSYVEVTQNELDNNEYIQKVKIGTESNYYSNVGLGFKATMPLKEILNIYKNLTVKGRPGDVTDKAVALDDKFTASVSVAFALGKGTGVKVPTIEDFTASATTENKNQDMTATVTEADNDTQFIESKNITFYAAGEYTITVQETFKADKRNYIDYDSAKHTFNVVVANEPDSNGKPKITVRKNDVAKTNLREEGKQEKIIIENTLNTGYVTVKKEVKGESANPNDVFTFTINVTNAPGMKSFHILKGTNSKEIKTGGTFTLKANESAIIYDIPVGATVTVTETANPAYTTKVGENETNSASVEIKSVGQNKEITFTNTHKEADLAIAQKVTKSDPKLADEKFTYQIQLDGIKYNFKLKYTIGGNEAGTLEFTNGTATLDLKKDQIATIKGLPLNCKYTVTQTNRPKLYKITGITGKTGATTDVKKETITDTLGAATGGTAETVKFTDEFETGNLTIQKTVYGAKAAQDFTFNLTLTAPDGITLADKYNTDKSGVTLTKVEGKDNEYSLTVNVPNGTETYNVTIKDLPLGTKVNITENATPGYVLTKQENNTDVEIAKTPKTAEFVNNAVPEVTVTVKKNFDTALLEDSGRTFDFDFTALQTTDKTGTGTATTVSEAKDVALEGTLKFTDISKTNSTGEVTLTGKYDLDYIKLFNNKAGSVTYKYNVKETDGNLGGVVYDEDDHEVTVTVNMDANGKLSVSKPKDVTLNNKYEPKTTTFGLKVHKEITAASLPQKDNTFNFSVSAGSGEPAPAQASVSVTVPANATSSTGDGDFGKITFTHAGEYTYTLTETGIEAMSGFSCDTPKHTVKVTVVDTDGVLSVSEYTVDGVKVTAPLSDYTVTFTNAYDPADAELTLSVLKTVTGKALPSGRTYSFTFNVKATGVNADKVKIPNGKMTLSATTDRLNGGTTAKASFEKVTFSERGDYTLTVTESSELPDGFKENPTNYVLNIHVEDKGGALEVENCTLDGKNILESGAATVKIVNTYAPTPAQFTVSVVKTVSAESAPLTADYNFDFTLAPAAGEVVANYPKITKNTATATVAKGSKKSVAAAFSALSFDTAGTYKFTVTETKADEMFTKAGPQNLTVEVVDKGGMLAVAKVTGETPAGETGSFTGTTLTFENQYTPKPASLTVKVDNIVALQDRHAPLADGHEYEFSFELSEKAEKPNATLPTEIKKSTEKINKNFTGYADEYKTNYEDRTLKIAFDKITFNTAGEYNFTVTEEDILSFTGAAHSEKHKEAFITYPTDDLINIAVKVEDINGQLTVTGIKIGEKEQPLSAVDAETTLRFVNFYHAEPSHFIFEIDKTVNGTLPEGHYTFNFTVKLVDSLHEHKVKFYNNTSNVPITGDEFKAAGSAVGYVGVDFTEPGDYTFKVTETIVDGGIDGSSAFNSSDVREHTVVVNVVDDIGKMRVNSYTIDENAPVENPKGLGSHKDYFVGKVPFVNNYIPKPITLKLNIEKKMSDGSNALPKSYNFGFGITSAKTDGAEVGTPKPTVTLNKDEIAKTATSVLNFTKAGTYSFNVSEDGVTDPGFKDHPAAKKVTVAVGDKGGELYIASVHVGAVNESYTPGKPSEPETQITEYKVTFINNYDPDDAELTLKLSKTLSGKNLPKDHSYTFKFALTKPTSANAKGGSDVTISEVTSESEKTLSGSFGTLTFDKVGEYRYTVAESITDSKPTEGVANSGFKAEPSGAAELVINVSDDGSGALKIASVTFGGKALAVSDGAATVNYTNEYSYTPVDFTFKVDKEIIGNELVDGHKYEFDFKLENSGKSDGVTMPTNVNMTLTKSGTDEKLEESFGVIKFTEPGEYTFNVSEEKVRDNGTEVDTFKKSADYTVTITVKDAGGKLVIDKFSDGKGGTEYDADTNTATLGFRNTYDPDDAKLALSVLKTVTGNALPTLPSGKTFDFTFNVEATGDHADKVTILSGDATLSATAAQLNGGATAGFETVTFSEKGDYTLTVTESSKLPDGFKANLTKYVLNIHVEDNGGALAVTGCTLDGKNILESGAATVKIENTYDPNDVGFTVKVNKTVGGSTVLDEDNAYNFKFALSGIKNGGGTAPTAPARIIENITESTKDGISPLSFELTFTEAGTYTFNLSETVTDKYNTPGNCGFTVPDLPSIIVVVADKGTGSLEIESYSVGAGRSETGSEAVINVENFYNPKKAEDFEVFIDKTVTGDGLPTGYGEFEFTLTPDSKNPTGAAAEGNYAKVSYSDLGARTEGKYTLADGAKSLSKIDFTAAGTYNFTVAENVSYGGFTAENSSFTLTVNVIDDKGVLKVVSCSVSPDKGAVISDNSVTVPFVNVYDAGSTSLNVSVNKTLTGNSLPEGHEYTFTFTLYEDGKPILNKSVSSNELKPDTAEEISLGAITYEAAGEHTYTVSETVTETVGGEPVEDVNGNNHGFGTTDSYTISVSVEDKVSGSDHSLSVSCNGASKYDAAKNLATLDFINTYTPEKVSFTLGVSKTVSGNALPEGHEYDFMFTLDGSHGDVKTAAGVTEKTKAVIPDIIFDLPEFTEAGEYSYTVTESVAERFNGSAVTEKSGFVAAKPVKVTVTVVDDGGKLRVKDCTVDGVPTGETEKYMIGITNRYVPEAVSVDDPKTPGGTDDNVVEISKILKTEGGTFIDFPEAFRFNAEVAEIDGGEKTPEPGTAGWGNDFAASTVLTAAGGIGGRGSVAVSGLRFAKAGVYKVTVTEDSEPYSNDYGSIRKDVHSAEIIYTVSDKGGKLEISDVDYTETEFVNTFIPNVKTVEMTFDKRLINTMTGGDRLALTEGIDDGLYNKFKTLYDGRFSFTMSHDEFDPQYIETDVADSGAELISDGRITAVNKMNKVRLGNVIIKREGSYTFTVSENQPTEGNRAERVGYGRRAITVTFNVTADPKTGELKVSADYMYGKDKTAEKPAFINTYGPIPCTLTVKTEVTTDPEGLEFDRTKAFEYEIRVWGDHITPDADRNAEGKRTATFRIFYENSIIQTIALNDEEEDTSVPVEFVETAEGSGIYAFTVSGYGGNSFTIEDIPYGGVYYSVQQKLGAKDNALGYTFTGVDELYTYKDTAETVSRSEDRTDTVRQDPQLETGEFFGEFDGTVITYHNLYTVTAKSETVPGIEKKMSGERGLIEGEEYSFAVSLDAPEGGAALSEGERTVTAAAATDPTTGEVTATADIGEITFTKPGVYKVTVKEVMPVGGEFNGVKYDGTVYTVVYNVTDTDPATGVKDGQLRADMTVYADGKKADAIVFTNTYSAADTGEVSFDISKLVIPDDPSALPHDEEYRFRVIDENGLSKDTEAAVTVYPDDYDSTEGLIFGKTTVSLGTFGDKGSYSFTVSEIPANTLGMVYDRTEHTVTVEVTDNLKGGLEYEVYVDGILSSEAEFINRYMTGSVTVTNTLTGTGIDVTLPFKYKVTVTGSEDLPGKYNYTVGSSGGMSLLSFGGIINPRETSKTVVSGGTIELKHGEKFTVTGIPEGAMVKIEQQPQDGYTTSVNGEERFDFSATVSSTEEIKAEYLNRHYNEFGRFDDFVFKSQTYPGAGESVSTGDTLSYTIDWRNPKTVEATVVIKDILSEGVDLVEASDGYEYDPDTRTVTWSINARGLESGTVELTVKVNESAEELGSVSNTSHAEVYVGSEPGTGSPGEPSAEDDSDEVTNPVVTVSIEKRESVDGTDLVESLSVRAGDIITYYLTASVSGADAKNLTIADIIPEGLEYVGSSDGNAVYDPTTGTVTWTFTDANGEPEIIRPGDVTVSYSVRAPEVSGPAGWSSCGYVYEGVEAAPDSPSADYPWTASNYVEALPASDLTVVKTVHSEDGTVPTGIKFRFTVEIADENGLPVSGIVYEKNGVKGAASDGKLLVNLGDGESVTLYDIPAGSTYKISEEPVTNYTSDPGNIYSGLLKNIDTVAEIVNNYSFVGQKFGDITVTKAVVGTDDDMLRKFGFTFTLADTSINGVYGDLEFIDGEARFSLSNGEAVTAVGLPADVGYTVTENAADAEGFKIMDSGNTVGTVPADNAVTVMFFNEREDGAVGGLTVKNTVIGGSKSFSFAVQLYGGQPVSGQYGDMVFDDTGLAVFTLAPGQSVTAVGLPAGTLYTVTETDADTEGYFTEFTDDCAGVIPSVANANVEFINTRRTGSLTVKNTVIGGDDEFSYTVRILGGIEPGRYGDLNFNADGTAAFTLINGMSVTATGLPAGASYEVTETEANQRGYVTASSGASGIIPESLTANASFINTLPTPGSLTVSKTVIGGNGSESFRFILSLKDTANEPLVGVFGEIETDPDGTAEFTLSDGMSITVPLPEGTVYSVNEDVLSAAGYISEVSGAASGTVTKDGSSVAFTNTLKTGSLTVSDYIGGNAADPEKTFTFTVTAPVTGRYGDMVFDESGTAVFTLGNGQSATAEGLPEGVAYTVTETDANADGYVTECNGIEYTAPVLGVIAENTVSEARFRNIRQIDDTETIGSLTVVNNIIGTVTDEEFVFTVTVEDPKGLVMAALLEDGYSVGTINADGGIKSMATGPNGETVIQFALKHGESKRINGLSAGAKYTVTESGSLYYLVSSVNSVGTVPGGGNRTAVFTNRWNAGDLSVGVTVEDDSGIIRTDDRAEFTYRVTLDGVGSEFGYPSHITDNYTEAEASGKQLISFDKNGVAEFTLRGGETALAPDLPVGIGYKVELVSRSDELHYDKSESGTAGVITAGELSEAEYVYYIKTGSFTLTKKLLNNYNQTISRSVDFNFTIKLYGADGLPLSGSYVYDGSHSGTVKDQDVISLRGGESVTVYGLPEGAVYIIAEDQVLRYPMIAAENSNGVIIAGKDIKAVITNRLFVDPEKHKPQDPGSDTEPGTPDTPDEPDDPGKIEIDRPTEGLIAEEEPGGDLADAPLKEAFTKLAARKKEF